MFKGLPKISKGVRLVSRLKHFTDIKMWILSVVIVTYFTEAVNNEKKTAMAHMVNHPEAITWAVSQGANGIEVDLQFSGDSPKDFRHSNGFEPCDCTCICLGINICPENGVCRILVSATNKHCKATGNLEEMIDTMATTSGLAVIYIDSKLTETIIDQKAAGKQVISLMNKVFRKGFKGQMVISGSEPKYLDYLLGAKTAAMKSPYAKRYFYTFGIAGNDYEGVWKGLLKLNTNQIVYWTGSSICLPENMDKAVEESSKKPYASIGIWTLDSVDAMKHYANDLHVDSIITNYPARAVEVFGKANLAKPGEALVPDPTFTMFDN